MRIDSARWRRLAARSLGALAVAALILAVALALSAGGSNNSYRVRAIFDDAGNLIAGENVKIDGVKVGTVETVAPTPRAQAAVVMKIENPGFTNFRADASCTIRPQALIGEKYVDCLPTQPRVEGTPLPPPLPRSRAGRKAQVTYLLPVQNTHSPVDVDLLGDINRLPERQRFTIILNEFGAGLAGRGSDLSAVIRRANPALQELDRVLAILAGENKVLAKLAVDSDQALAPLARVRKQFAEFFAQSATVPQASANQRGALQRNLELFPPFLKQLAPALERVQRFAEADHPDVHEPARRGPVDQPGLHPPAGVLQQLDGVLQDLGKTAQVNGPALVGDQAAARNSSARSETRRCRSRPTSPHCSKACATPAASSACSTSPSSAPAPPTATTRSGTSCARKASRTSA